MTGTVEDGGVAHSFTDVSGGSSNNFSSNSSGRNCGEKKEKKKKEEEAKSHSGKVLVEVHRAADFWSSLEAASRTMSMDLQLPSSSFFSDMLYISAGLEEPCHTLEGFSLSRETLMLHH